MKEDELIISCQACDCEIGVQGLDEKGDLISCPHCSALLFVDLANNVVKVMNHELKVSQQEHYHEVQSVYGDEQPRRRKGKLVLFLVLLILISAVGIALNVESIIPREINVPDSAGRLQGQNVEHVIERFKDAGFQNIETIREYVTSLGFFFNRQDDESVISILINGQTRFSRNDVFYSNATVTITYRKLGSENIESADSIDSIEIDVPDSSRRLRGQNIEYVIERFEDAGFQNIEAIREYVTSLGLFNRHNDESVTDISINGETGFSRNDIFNSNATVIITYRQLESDVENINGIILNEINVPDSSRRLRGQNIEYVIERFEDAGFQNIETIREYVTSLGFFFNRQDDELVTDISINGETRFTHNAVFYSNATVTITYQKLESD